MSDRKRAGVGSSHAEMSVEPRLLPEPAPPMKPRSTVLALSVPPSHVIKKPFFVVAACRDRNLDGGPERAPHLNEDTRRPSLIGTRHN